jgi:hypothetical protein
MNSLYNMKKPIKVKVEWSTVKLKDYAKEIWVQGKDYMRLRMRIKNWYTIEQAIQDKPVDRVNKKAFTVEYKWNTYWICRIMEALWIDLSYRAAILYRLKKWKTFEQAITQYNICLK